MKMNKIKNICIILLIIVIVTSLIITVKTIANTKEQIEESISEDLINNEEVRQGIINERNNIKKQEYFKIILVETIIVATSIAGIVVLEIKTKKKED